MVPASWPGPHEDRGLQMLLSRLAGCHGDGGCVCVNVHVHMLRCISNLLLRFAPEMPTVGGQTNLIILERRGGKDWFFFFTVKNLRHTQE